MHEIDPELDRRLALLREVAEPTLADKRRLLVALHTSIHAHTDAASELVLPERAAGVARHWQPWAIAARPPLPWLGRALIGATAALAIGFGLNYMRRVRDAEPTAFDGGAALAAAHENTNTGAVRLAERVDVLASEEPAASEDGSAGALGIARERPTPMLSGRAAPDRWVPPGAPNPLDLGAGLEQLHRAERALYAGDAELALGILSNLDRRAEPALLREERLTTRVLALCQRGRVEEALDARRELEREFASSIYLRRLDQSCAVQRGRR